MKSLAILALSVVATAAMANGGGQPDYPQIQIEGLSVQIAAMKDTSIRNYAGDEAQAIQNVASNAGNVDVENHGKSFQIFLGKDSSVHNSATGHGSYASQNLSSNLGDVEIEGTSLQITAMWNSSASNQAQGHDSKAVQNIASNNACVTCQPTRK